MNRSKYTAGATRRGFTLSELAVVFVLIGILVSIAVPTYNALRSTTEERGDVVRLRAAVAHARSVAGQQGNAYEYPESLVSDMAPMSGDYTTGAVTGSYVSVHRVSGTVAHFAMRGEDNSCLVVVDDITIDTQVYGVDIDAATCSAANVVSASVSGTYLEPNSITLP